MLEKILKLYVMYMAADIRSPLPHLFGPPGCGKSTVVETLAELLDVQLHIINVSRLSPLEIEGVQMPHGSGEEMVLKMLPATFWTQLREGDILLLDEFLRGFPEVYNALLDILTARRAGAHVLPKVFIIGASNSTVSYDKALEDRLLHLPVPDPRNDKKEKNHQAKILTEALGLLPEMAKSSEMMSLLGAEVDPMYEILDGLGKKSGTSAASLNGRSIRNLIGQAKFREVQSPYLQQLIDANNRMAAQAAKWQYVFLLDGRKAWTFLDKYEEAARSIKDNPRLTDLQKQNLELNLQLIEMERIRTQKEDEVSDDIDEPVDIDDLLG